jgi:hypothetical protein
MSISEDIRNLYREFGGHADSYIEFNNAPLRGRIPTIEVAWGGKAAGDRSGDARVREDAVRSEPVRAPVLTRFSGRTDE